MFGSNADWPNIFESQESFAYTMRRNCQCFEGEKRVIVPALKGFATRLRDAATEFLAHLEMAEVNIKGARSQDSPLAVGCDHCPDTESQSPQVWVDEIEEGDCERRRVSRNEAESLTLPECRDVLFNEITRTLLVRGDGQVKSYTLRGRALRVFLRFVPVRSQPARTTGGLLPCPKPDADIIAIARQQPSLRCTVISRSGPDAKPCVCSQGCATLRLTSRGEGYEHHALRFTSS